MITLTFSYFFVHGSGYTGTITKHGHTSVFMPTARGGTPATHTLIAPWCVHSQAFNVYLKKMLLGIC